MVFSQTFANLSKRASQKAPSFFDSSYHLRNYTQLVAPELFSSNTSKENSGGNNNSSPKYQYGIYNYSILLDPYTSSLIYHNHHNNNAGNNTSGNKFSNNPYNSIDEEFIANNNVTSKLISPKPQVAKSHLLAMAPAGSQAFLDAGMFNKRAIGYLVSGKRSYATVSESKDLLLKKSKLGIEGKFAVKEQKKAKKTKRSLDVALKKKFVASLDDELLLSSDSLKKSLVGAMKDSVQRDNLLNVYPIYQALKRNGLAVSVPVFNIVLYLISAREVPGESIESRLTTILNIYSDLIGLQLKPNVNSYEIVLNSLLQGAFDSYRLFLENKSIEVTRDDDGSFLKKKIDNGSNYYRLALEIFMASNFSKRQDYPQNIYELLLTGLNVFNYRFKDTTTFSKFLKVLNGSKNLKRNELYYVNLICYGVKVSVMENDTEEASSDSLGYKFVLDMYNEFKLQSDSDTALLVQQFNVYALLLHSLCQLNQLKLATTMLDNLLISIKSGNSKTVYTEKSASSLDSKDKIVVDQTGELNKVIIYYLCSMVDANLAKSVELFEKFISFHLIKLDENQSLNNQYLINALIKSCESSDFETANYIFNNHIKENLINGVFKTSTDSSTDKMKFLLQSLLCNSHNHQCNNLSKALGAFLQISLQTDNFKNIVPYLQFENGLLTQLSKNLLGHLEEDALVDLVGFMAHHQYPFVPHIISFLDTVTDLNSDNDAFDHNRILTRLCNNEPFVNVLYGHYDSLDAKKRSNVAKFFKSTFFLACNKTFSIKQYVTESESSIFNSNKFFGLLAIWYAFWNTKPSKSPTTYSSLISEFNDLDNYYLQKNIDNELVDILQRHERFESLNDVELSFYTQLNALVQFKDRLYHEYNVLPNS